MDYYIEEAYKVALKSTMKNKYGAILIHRNRIVSSGYNRSTSLTSKNKHCIL
jgi:deoxycytidylate deaminase